MSNTTVPISEWCKEIRVALARKEMNLQSVADEIGYSYTTITALISGRIVKDNYLDIAKKINEVLEVNVLPEKPQLPSDEWCGAVRAKLYVKKMNISELSKSIGFNRDKACSVGTVKDHKESRGRRDMKTGKYTKDGREMQVGDVVHFRCKNHPLSGKGVVFMGKEVDGLGEDPFRIRDTRTGRNNGRIYPYYDDAVYRIDGREGE